MIDKKSLDHLNDHAQQALAEDLPVLVERMRLGNLGTTKRVGKLTITVEIVDDPGNDTKAPETLCRIDSKLALPKNELSERKVIWQDGQMALL